MVRHWIVMTMRTRDSDGCFKIDDCLIVNSYYDFFFIEWIDDKSLTSQKPSLRDNSISGYHEYEK